jgi:hypothetical protein
MNKLLAICGIVFIGNTTTPQIENSVPDSELQKIETIVCELKTTPVKLVSIVEQQLPVTYQEASWAAPKHSEVLKTNDAAELNLSEIVFIESEEEIIDLGFDTADYLPENFDPCKVYFDLNKVTYIEEGDEISLDFDSENYLPKNFDPYGIPSDITAISYIEEEDEIDLGFDTAAYLPEGFDPYEVYFDLNSVEYIEEEDEVELGFDTTDYLPRGFDPYSR